MTSLPPNADTPWALAGLWNTWVDKATGELVESYTMLTLNADNHPLMICLVIGIADGDTLTTRCETPTGMDNFKVRLAEIDAPEKGQAFGNRSKQHLSDLCFRKPAEVRPQTKDRYGRTVARVTCDGVDANAEQVRAGMAWVFDKYVTDRALYAVQYEARAARRRLWADAVPMAPWEWRQSKAVARQAAAAEVSPPRP